LQSLDATDDFVHVASEAGRVVEGEHKLVFGVGDKHSTERRWMKYIEERETS
jgi:hypothetical protein